jgi:hypothetical protein
MMSNKYPPFEVVEMKLIDLYGPAMEIDNTEDAAMYFERLVEWAMQISDQTREEAERIQHANLGYYAGYYDHETRIRVENLFQCAHPIFGKAIAHTPTADEALEIGLKLGHEARDS